MYVGIDIGGTKTLLAALTNDGTITESIKFSTPVDYDDFLVELKANFAKLKHQDFRAGAVAAPAVIDRRKGALKDGGNVHWHGEHLQHAVERITHCPMLLENDANLAGLSEAMLVKDKYDKVLYLTISTGIGGGFIVNQQIDPVLADIEPGQIMLQRGDRIVKWESFASGKAIYERYGKKASDIEDAATWRAIVKDWTIGFVDLLAITQPDVIILGGGVGRYLAKYHDLLVDALEQHVTPLVAVPPIIKAKRPEEAVVYGCFDLARGVYV